MMRTIKVYFLERQVREKLLLVVFVAAITVVWLVSFSGRVRRFWQDAQVVRATLADQDSWLRKSDSIEARSRAAISKLDPLKTYNDTRLFGEINLLANQAFRTKPQVATEPSKKSGQFAINSVTATINATNSEADWQSIRKFYLSLEKLSPYINIEQFDAIAARNSLTLKVRATSIEVIR
jgi:hypothetical protein